MLFGKAALSYRGPVTPVDTAKLSFILDDNGAYDLKVRLDPDECGYGVLDKITFKWFGKRWAVQFVARDAAVGYLLVHGNGRVVNRGPQKDTDGMRYDFGEIIQTLDAAYEGCSFVQR